MSAKIQVQFSPTPNPQSMKFTFSQPIAREVAEFADRNQAQRSPLANKIFGFPWAAAVMVGNDFVTITKQEWVDWEIIAEPLARLLQEHVEIGEAVILDDHADDTTDDSPVVAEIKRILNEDIRPFVAMDGGDIVFHRYEGGVVYVYMRGACSGCPSSMMTLKEGVENRLKAEIPEIIEVIAL
jgi:Fe-S cluster biogenesis protein NfuA